MRTHGLQRARLPYLLIEKLLRETQQLNNNDLERTMLISWLLNILVSCHVPLEQWLSMGKRGDFTFLGTLDNVWSASVTGI